MMNTFEGDEIMMKKPKIIQVEVDDNWKQRNVKLKFERWSVKVKFEEWRIYGWKELKLINLKMKKFNIETDNIITGKKESFNSEKVCLDDIKVKTEEIILEWKTEYSVK